MSPKFYYLIQDIINIINEFLKNEIDFSDIKIWLKKHPCANKNLCNNQEKKIIEEFHHLINKSKGKSALKKFGKKLEKRYIKDKFVDST